MKRQRYFEWLDGELQGTTSVLDFIEEEDGETYYNFTDGEICNAAYISPMTGSARDLNGKMLVEVASPTEIWRLEDVKSKIGTKEQYGETVEIPTLDDVLAANGQQNATIARSTVGSRKWTAPGNMPKKVPALPTIDEYGKPAPKPVPTPAPVQVPTPVQAPAPAVEAPVEQPVLGHVPFQITSHRSEDPVAILVRTCKKHSTDIDLTISMDLPARSTFRFVANEFEGGADKFISYVLEDLDPSLVFEALKDALLDAYDDDETEPELSEDK